MSDTILGGADRGQAAMGMGEIAPMVFLIALVSVTLNVLLGTGMGLQKAIASVAVVLVVLPGFWRLKTKLMKETKS